VSKNVIEYRCLLISPGDVAEERDAISAAVVQWNAQIGSVLGARIELVRWETHSVPDASAPPQEVLNQQIVDDCDFGIAIFSGRLGTPTTTSLSGSVEEIDRLRERGARLLVYFSTAPIPQSDLKDDQYAKLADYRDKLRSEGLSGEFQDVSDLEKQILLHLTSVVAWLLEKDRGQPSPDGTTQATPVLTAPVPDVRVVVFPAETYPPTRGIKHLLGIHVQNHSPAVVFISGISIMLKGNRGLLLYRDAITGAEQSRRSLRPGESFRWSANCDDLLRDYSIDDIDGVVVHDDIGRQFREANGTLQTIFKKWLLEDQEKSETSK
jgi:hypothetical protein